MREKTWPKPQYLGTGGRGLDLAKPEGPPVPQGPWNTQVPTWAGTHAGRACTSGLQRKKERTRREARAQWSARPTPRAGTPGRGREGPPDTERPDSCADAKGGGFLKDVPEH